MVLLVLMKSIVAVLIFYVCNYVYLNRWYVHGHWEH